MEKILVLLCLLFAFSLHAQSLPVANISAPQIVLAGKTESISGINSYDPDGGTVVFRWRLLKRPSFSSAELSSTKSATPNIKFDREGIYVLELRVKDTDGISSSKFHVVTAVKSDGDVIFGPDSIPSSLTCSDTASPECQVVERTFSISSPAGSYYLVGENNGAISAQVELNGEIVEDFYVYNGQIETSNSLVHLNEVNTLRLKVGGENNGTLTLSILSEQLPAISNSAPLLSSSDINFTGSIEEFTQINVVDPDTADNHTFEIISKPLHGNASVNADGVVSYLADEYFEGSDSIVISVTDSGIPARSSVVEIRAFFNTANQPPILSAPILRAKGSQVSGQITVKDNDNQSHTYSVLSEPSFGTVQVDPISGFMVYGPTQGYVGTDSFVVRVTDDGQPIKYADIEVFVEVDNNTLPLVEGEGSFQTEQGGSVTAGLYTYDDPDPEQTHSYSLEHDSSFFNYANITPEGLLSFQLTPTAVGTSTLSVVVTDSAGGVGNKGVIVEALPNIPPMVRSDSVNVRASDSTTISVFGSDLNQGQSLSYSIAQQPSNGTATIDGQSISYTPNEGFSGEDTIFFTVTDDGVPAQSSSGRLTITVI